MLLLVSYDLKVPGRDYTKLYETLKTANEWWHFLESTWILKTNDTVDTWTQKLRATTDANDRFIVVDITSKKPNGWLPNDAWSWINSRNI